MNENKNQIKDFYSAPYYTENGCLCYLPVGRQDSPGIMLCNFAPRIVREVIVDDGAEKTRRYLIGGTDANGNNFTPVEVPAGELEKMAWIANCLDASCDLCVVSQVEKHVRCAIKTTARFADKRYIFSHTGWKKIGGEWHYLLPGDKTYQVELKGKQRNYYGAEGMSREDAEDLVKLLSGGMMPDEVLLPCLATVFLSPLNEFLRQIGHEPKYLLTLIGRTGSMKSTVAALMLSFFGNFSATDLPMSFRDTANSIVHNAFALKDVLTCVDDYHPTARSDASQMKATMQTLARGYGDRAARNRLGSDITLREPRPPQGNVIVTAEFAPDIGESGTARLFCVEMKPGSICLPLLTEAQEQALDGCFVRCMGAFIRYIKERHLKDGQEQSSLERLKMNFSELRSHWRTELKEASIPFHDRLPDTLACLEVGFLFLTDFLCAKDITDERDATELQNRLHIVLLHLSAKQSESVEADRPTHIFLRKLYSLIECGNVCLLPATGRTEIPPKNYIGYEDETYYYLMLDASHKAVKRLCGEQDEGFAISAKSLAKALADEGLIEPGDNGTNTRTMRFGGRLKRVMLLRKEKANKLVSV